MTTLSLSLTIAQKVSASFINVLALEIDHGPDSEELHTWKQTCFAGFRNIQHLELGESVTDWSP